MKRASLVICSLSLGLPLLGCDRPADAPAVEGSQASPQPVAVAPEPSPGAGLPASAITDPPRAPQEKLVPPNPLSGSPEFVRSIWTRLAGSKDACAQDFDYWPQGGLVSIACHVGDLSEPKSVPGDGLIAALEVASGMKVFLSGPHDKGLRVTPGQGSPGSFGRYNPKFVRWLGGVVVPAPEERVARDIAGPLYRKYLKGQADTFAAVHDMIEARGDCYQNERRAYEEMIESANEEGGEGAERPWRWHDWLAPNYCAIAPGEEGFEHTPDSDYSLHDPNIVRDALGFWIRRDIDGTRKLWRENLERAQKAYDDSPPNLERDDVY